MSQLNIIAVSLENVLLNIHDNMLSSIVNLGYEDVNIYVPKNKSISRQQIKQFIKKHDDNIKIYQVSSLYVSNIDKEIAKVYSSVLIDSICNSQSNINKYQNFVYCFFDLLTEIPIVNLESSLKLMQIKHVSYNLMSIPMIDIDSIGFQLGNLKYIPTRHNFILNTGISVLKGFTSEDYALNPFLFSFDQYALSRAQFDLSLIINDKSNNDNEIIVLLVREIIKSCSSKSILFNMDGIYI